MTNILDTSLQERQSRIDNAKEYLEQTRKIFEEFGSTELKASHARFPELLNALESNEVRLVVIGEFSRGKSSLVNALLNVNLLRSAQEATTAINTFVRALPTDRSEQFIRIHFQDGRPVQDVAWTDDKVLERWGTELDEAHADVRKQIDFIEIFHKHPLLSNGLTLIDTPGLQSVVAHHEIITRKAIAGAHIALWVQSTSQLGGNATEWDFLSDTIRQNFRKFITVVNMWDAVLEPTDAQEQAKEVRVREQEKMERIKRNFRKHLESQPAHEIEALTDSDHLMGVSALWALSNDPAKQQRSGIEKLARRLAEMLSSGEAMEQIYRKPLQQLTHIQEQLARTIQDEQQLLASDKSLSERQRELEIFEKDIQILSQESAQVTVQSREEHDRAGRHFSESVQRQLVAPLTDLKSEIEIQVTERYVGALIKRREKITLPEELHEQYKSTTQDVSLAWERQKRELAKALEGLRTDYASQMAKHAGTMRGEMAKIDIEIPSLDVGFTLDFSSIEDYHRDAIQLQDLVSKHQKELDQLESDISTVAPNQAKLEIARQAVSRAERTLEQVGQQPAPITRSRSRLVSEGGLYSDDKYRQETYEDSSNVDAWLSELAERKKVLDEKEKWMLAVAAEEERKTGLRISKELMQKRYEKELADLQRKQSKLESKIRQDQDQLIHDTTLRLIRSTAGQLEQRIRYLQEHVSGAIEKIFNDQLELLKQCVEEQCLEPLNAKRLQRQEVQILLHTSQEEIAQRKVRLSKAKQDVADLQKITLHALEA